MKGGSAAWDVVLMEVVQGGKERTKKEFTTLPTAAGFRDIKSSAVRAINFYVIEFLKEIPHPYSIVLFSMLTYQYIIMGKHLSFKFLKIY